MSQSRIGERDFMRMAPIGAFASRSGVTDSARASAVARRYSLHTRAVAHNPWLALPQVRPLRKSETRRATPT